MRTLIACLLAAASFNFATPASAEFANNNWCVAHGDHYHCPDVCLREGGSLVGCNDSFQPVETRPEYPPQECELKEL